MAWFRKQNKPLEVAPEKRVQTEGLWVKCGGCKNILWKKDLEANLLCCPKCDRHFKMGAKARLELLFDEGRYAERDRNLASTDPLGFRDSKPYRDRLAKAEKITGLKDALITGEGLLEKRRVV